jgi:glycerate 2-kinase
VKGKYVVFAENRMLCDAAERKAAELGINALTISTSIEGEAKDVGVVLASIAREIEKSAKPFKPPCVLIAGGETTVTITHRNGEGGRNQELALATALRISGSDRIVAASIGTDGTDGPTDIAGGIVDGYSLRESRRVGIEVEDLLRNHNSSRMFRTLNDAIYTNDTATNLMDLMVIYVA